MISQRSGAEFWQPEKSEWHWIHNKTEVVQTIEGNPEWMVFNLQQTGMRLIRDSIKFKFKKIFNEIVTLKVKIYHLHLKEFL